MLLQCLCVWVGRWSAVTAGHLNYRLNGSVGDRQYSGRGTRRRYSTGHLDLEGQHCLNALDRWMTAVTVPDTPCSFSAGLLYRPVTIWPGCYVALLFTCLSLHRVHPPSPPSAAFFGLHFSKSYNGVSEQQHVTAVVLSWQWTCRGCSVRR